MTDHTTRAPGDSSEHGTARGPATEVRKQTREFADDVASKARAKGTELKRRAESMAEERKSGAADSIGAVATALHAAGDSLREQDYGDLSSVGNEVADRVERMASYLRNHDVRALISDLEDFGRRNPAAFLGTTFVGGLVLGRFLRSSRSHDRSSPRTTKRRDRADGETEWTGSAGAGPAAMTPERPLGGGSPPMMSGGHNE